MEEERNNNELSDDERKLVLFMGGDPDNLDDEDEITEGEFLSQGCLVALLVIVVFIVLWVACMAN